MKKIFISLFLSGVFMYHTNAQTAVEGNKFLDNWSIGISAGGTTPLTHHSFFGNMRPITGIELNKQLTPVFGFGLEAVGSFNTSQSRTIFDRSNVSLLGLVNLNNLLGTYTGSGGRNRVVALLYEPGNGFRSEQHVNKTGPEL